MGQLPAARFASDYVSAIDKLKSAISPLTSCFGATPPAS